MVVDISMALTTIFMKASGLWMAANDSEQRLRNIALCYTIFLLLFGMGVMLSDFYNSWEDISACLYITCNTLSLAISIFKIIILYFNREDFFKLIIYMQKKFLTADYDSYEETVVDSAKRTCNLFILLFTSFTQITVGIYFVQPIIENMGRNSSDRVLPFRMWVNLPLSETPYYEITYTIQVLSLYQIGVCYFCFDNFLCIMNLHVAGQFRILQYRLGNLSIGSEQENLDISSVDSADKRYSAFRNCVQQHQALIAFCSTLEHVFSSFVLGQIMVFSLVICLDGYQVLTAEASIGRRFIFHTGMSLSQLLMFTYSCDCVIQESTGIAEALYGAPWTYLPMSKQGKMLRKDLILTAMRSRVPCCLTAYGFFVVSLQTYTSVLSTAMSYFTLLRQSTESMI